MLLLLAAAAQPVLAPETIIVRAERLRVSANSAQSLTSQDLANLPVIRLDEALRLVPGVGLFRRTSSGAANATIQGLSLRPIAPNGAGRALVSLDGVPQNDPFGGWVYWGRYDPIFLEQVEIKRGGEGAGYGPMALTGTLDLTEARGRPGAFDVSFGGPNAAHVAGRGSVKTDGAVFTAMGAYDASDGAFGISRAQRGAVDQAINFQSISMALVTDIARANGAWSFRGAGFSEDKGAGLIGGQSTANGLDISIARRFDWDFGQSRVLIFAQGRDFSNQTVSVTSGRSASIPALDQYATPSSALGGSFAFEPGLNSRLPSLTIDGRRSEGETRERFRFIGSDFTRTRLAGGRQDLLGMGLSLPRPLNLGQNQFQLDGTLRLDYWVNHNGIRQESDRGSGAVILLEQAEDTSGTVMSGRVSLAQARGPASITLYRTFRPPTLNELHRPFRIGNDVTEANAKLVPETLVGLDFDLRASRRFGEGRLVSSATLYINRLNDPITNVTLATGPGVFPRVGFLPVGGSLRERRNVGHIDATGIEARVSWGSQQSPLTWFLAASFTQARVDGGSTLPQLTGKRPAQAPNWSAAANITWPATGALTMTLSLRAEGERYEDDLNTRKLARYYAVDMRAAWRVRRRTEIYVSGENVFDEKIATALAGDGIVSLAQGRRVRLGVKIGG